jgi:hypothetical protein
LTLPSDATSGRCITLITTPFPFYIITKVDTLVTYPANPLPSLFPYLDCHLLKSSKWACTIGKYVGEVIAMYVGTLWLLGRLEC